MNFWLSWKHYFEDGEFELHFPWWVSGFGDDYETIVAAVKADSSEDAWKIIEDAYDYAGVYIEQRFCDEFEGSPFSDRFPKADWMIWS